MKTGFLICLIWLTLLTCTGEAAVIRLREQANVTVAVIRLGDIAQISEAAPEAEAHLRNLTISPAPAAGRTAKVTVDMVRRELALRGIDQSALQFLGSSETLVHRPALQEQPAELPQRKPTFNTAAWERELTLQIKQHCQRHLPAGQQPQIQLDRLQLQQIQSQHPGASQWQVQTDRPWGVGPQELTVRGVSTEGQPLEVSLTCHITQRPQVLALRQGLPRGQVIRQNDLLWLEVDDTAGCLSAPEQAIGMETARSVRAETPLRLDDLRQMPLIKRNEVVAVTVQIGSIHVRRYCRSLEEGTLGQFITLVPVDGKEKVTARVAGLREAEIVLEAKPSPTHDAAPKQAIELGRSQSRPQVLPAQHQQPAIASPSAAPAAVPSGHIYSNRPAKLPEAH